MVCSSFVGQIRNFPQYTSAQMGCIDENLSLFCPMKTFFAYNPSCLPLKNILFCPVSEQINSIFVFLFYVILL